MIRGRNRYQEEAASGEAPKTPGAPAPTTPDPKLVELETRATKAEAEAKAAKEQADTAKKWLAHVAGRMSEQDQEHARQTAATGEARTKEEIAELLKDDPVAALDRHFVMRLGPVLDEHLSNQVGVMRSQARLDFIEGGTTDEEVKQRKVLWDKYAPEIDEFMNGFSNDVKGRKEAWLNGFKMVRARHIDDELAEREKAVADRHAGRLEGRGDTPTNGKPKKALTSLEKEMAKEFGMSDDEWREFGGGSGAPEEH